MTCPECGEMTREVRPTSIVGRACACERKWKEEILAGQRSMNVVLTPPGDPLGKKSEGQ